MGSIGKWKKRKTVRWLGLTSGVGVAVREKEKKGARGGSRRAKLGGLGSVGLGRFGCLFFCQKIFFFFKTKQTTISFKQKPQMGSN